LKVTADFMGEIVLKAPKKPCSECPWRKDVQIGRFPPERFRDMANTSYDMAEQVFACHKSTEVEPTVCAGFLARGSDHNLTVRLAYMTGEMERGERSGALPLYENFRAMAIANGVAPDDATLVPCRNNREHLNTDQAATLAVDVEVADKP
jgi:hypothetical protein